MVYGLHYTLVAQLTVNFGSTFTRQASKKCLTNSLLQKNRTKPVGYHHGFFTRHISLATRKSNFLQTNLIVEKLKYGVEHAETYLGD